MGVGSWGAGLSGAGRTTEERPSAQGRRVTPLTGTAADEGDRPMARRPVTMVSAIRHDRGHRAA